MFYINKFVGVLLNPISFTLVLATTGLVVEAKWKCRFGRALIGVSIFWLYLWSTPMVYRWIGGSLENEWPVILAEDAPEADAIVILGGGMGSNTNTYAYAEMWGGADRVWHAARLYKTGKAPIIIPSGTGDMESTVPLLVDFGVPMDAIRVDDKARNTEENAKFVEVMVSKLPREDGRRPRILLVTSAWHMRRSLLMFRKYAPSLEVIPAATDYEATVRIGDGFCMSDLIPSPDVFSANSYCFKEHLGYWGYKIFR